MISVVDIEDSWTCLHYAAAMVMFRIYSRLLDLGIDSSLRNSSNYTAVMILMCEHDYEDLSKYDDLSGDALLLKQREIVKYFTA